jgi:hypothetical protein
LGVNSGRPVVRRNGKGGLGVVVRAGLVSPPSLVRSAVEMLLTTLWFDVVDCARLIEVSTAETPRRLGLVSSAFVRSDSGWVVVACFSTLRGGDFSRRSRDR